MAIPRRELVDSETPGFYHCISRCVRRAYLCGDDPFTGQNCDHRKQWIEKRTLELASIFAVELYAYAIMADKKKLKAYRERLGSLSWFMSRLNEPLAKTSKGTLCRPLKTHQTHRTNRLWQPWPGYSIQTK